MPINLEKFAGRVEDFNKKYNLNFSLSNYHNVLTNEIKNMRIKTEENALAIQSKTYYDTVKQLYREVAIRAVKVGKADDNLFSDALLEAFDDIINGYSDMVHDEGGILAEPYGGKTKLERMQAIEDGLKDVPKTKARLYAEEYKKGERPIREMRAFANGLSTTELKNEEIVTALEYAKALSIANKSRSFWWKFFHPIRNGAEKRVAKQIEAKVEKTLNALRSDLNKDVKSDMWYEQQVTGKSANVLSNAIYELEKNISLLKHDENSKAAADKLAKEGEKVVEVPEGKYLADKKLFAIGYRPNIENINQELHEFEKIQKIVDVSDDWEKDGRKRFQTRQLFSENYSRCIDIKGILETDGIEAAKSALEEKSNGWWMTVDNQHNQMYNKHGEYRSSDIFLDKELEPIVEDIKEPEPIIEEKTSIVVDLKEEVAQTSEMIEIDQKQDTAIKQV